MNSLSAILVSLVGAAGVTLAQADLPATNAPDARDVAAAGELFGANCVACHQVPDLQFAVERAWLKQVADTA